MSYQRVRVVTRRTVKRPPGLLRAIGLGDAPVAAAPVVSPVAVPDSTLSQAQWQQQMLTTAQQQYAFIQQFNQQYVLHGYLQLAATLSIPLAAAAWKWIFGRKKVSMSL